MYFEDFVVGFHFEAEPKQISKAQILAFAQDWDPQPFHLDDAQVLACHAVLARERALLAALGLLPMALSHDIGAETQRPLAIVVIGGLVNGSLLALLADYLGL